MILAVTYVPANIFLALARTAIHKYADPLKASCMYTRCWTGLHTLSTIPGLLLALGINSSQALPVGGPIIVGCLCALWGVCCIVEGPVLKLPLAHRVLGHACVLAAHVSAPPMSELGQPSEAMIVTATLVLGDLYGGIVDACLNRVRAQAYLAGQESMRRSVPIKRVAFSVPASPTTRAPSIPGRRGSASRAATLDAMIKESLQGHLALSASSTSSSTQLQGPYIPQVGPSAQLVASPISSTWGHSFQPLWAVGGELPRPKAVIDEHAFRSFHFRRLLPLHLFIGSATLGIVATAPHTAIGASSRMRSAWSAGLVASLCLRVICHRVLLPATAHRVGSWYSAAVITAILISLSNVQAADAREASSASVVDRCQLSALLLLLCMSMHAFALPSSWRIALMVTSAILVTPRWPDTLRSTDRVAVWVIMHLATVGTQRSNLGLHLRFRLHASGCTLPAARSLLHAPRCTLHAARSPLHAPRAAAYSD